MVYRATPVVIANVSTTETLATMFAGLGHSAGMNLTTNALKAATLFLGTGSTTSPTAAGRELFATGATTSDWMIRPSCAVTHTVDQSIANNAVTALAFNTERYDHDTMHDTATNNSRMICKTAGKFLIAGSVAWESNSTGARFVAIRLNGGTYLAIDRRVSTTTSEQAIACMRDFAVNDYVELVVFQNSGGALLVPKLSSYSPELAAVWVGGG